MLDKLIRLLAKLVDTVLDVLKRLLAKLKPLLDRVGRLLAKLMAPLLVRVGRLLAKLMAPVLDKVRPLLAKLKPVLDRVRQLIDKLAAPVLDKARQLLAKVDPMLDDLLKKMKEWNPEGNKILKIAIGVLIVFLATSILYPQALWKKHAELIQDCRERMDNLNYAVNRYYQVNENHIEDLDSLLAFIAVDSMIVPRSVFELEKLSLYDAPYDSYLVGFTNTFHFDRIEVTKFKRGSKIIDPPDFDATKETEGELPDSILLTMLPKSLFEDVVAPVQSSMTSARGINLYFRNKGNEDIYWMIYSRGLIDRTDIPYDTVIVPSKEYLLYRDIEDLRIDPISKEPFNLILNTRISILGQILYSFVPEEEPDPAVLDNKLLTNLLINKLARSARGRLGAAMKRDTTLYGKQLEFQSEYFEMEITTLSPRRPTLIESEREMMIAVDSLAAFENPERIKRELFHASYDSLIRIWTDWELSREKLGGMTYQEKYQLTKVDTIGVTVAPPFGSAYRLPLKNPLNLIWGVGSVKHPGYVENNDLSWDEKR